LALRATPASQGEWAQPLLVELLEVEVLLELLVELLDALLDEEVELLLVELLDALLDEEVELLDDPPPAPPAASVCEPVTVFPPTAEPPEP